MESESSCRLECVNEERCKSYNFGRKKDNRERFKCQLSESDRFAGQGAFIEDKDFTYKGIKVIAPQFTKMFLVSLKLNS